MKIKQRKMNNLGESRAEKLSSLNFGLGFFCCLSVFEHFAEISRLPFDTNVLKLVEIMYIYCLVLSKRLINCLSSKCLSHNGVIYVIALIGHAILNG